MVCDRVMEDGTTGFSGWARMAQVPLNVYVCMPYLCLSCSLYFQPITSFTIVEVR